MDKNGNILSAQDYYPYGGILRSYSTGGNSINDRYKFTQKERDQETGYDYFGARYYDSELGKWMTPDPLADKYPGWSPYNYCADNPLRLIDPNGMSYSDLEGEGMRVIGRSRNSSLLDGENQNSNDDKKGIKNPYGKPNYSLNEFAEKNAGKSYDQIVEFTGMLYGRTIKKYRYIRDPLHPENEIDMVHFLVVGRCGVGVGAIWEFMQYFYTPTSAMDPQDLYSNSLGEKFYYYFSEDINKNPDKLVNYIVEFLNSDKMRETSIIHSIKYYR